MKTNIGEVNTTNTSLRRFASLDFLRGLAIFVMTFAHCFYHIYNYNWAIEDPSKLLAYPLVLVGLGLLIAYVASWNLFFLLISSTVNTISMVKKAESSGSINRSFLHKFIAGSGLLLVGYLVEGLGFYGFFGNGVRTNSWDPYSIWAAFFAIKTLQIIAWGLIITSIINLLLLRNSGHLKFYRNMWIYASLTFFVLSFTPLVQFLIDSLSWKIPATFPTDMDIMKNTYWPNEHVQAHNASFLTYFLVLFAGELLPFFPCLATAFIGSMIGLTLAQPLPDHRLPKVGFIGGFVAIIAGVFLLSIGLPLTVFTQRPALPSFLIQLGGQVIVLMLFLRLVEYRGKAKEFAEKNITKFFRRWSMISLSIFALEIFDILPKLFLNFLFKKTTGINFLEKSLGYGQLTLTLIIAIYSLLWYEVLIRAWSRFNFVCSLEWFLIKLQGLSRIQASERLNVHRMFNNVEWINLADHRKIPEAKIYGSLSSTD